MGQLFAQALATPLIALVWPGPETQRHIPGTPVK